MWKLEQWKLNYSADKLILGGDFNVVPDCSQDCFPSRASYHILIIIFLLWSPNLICVIIGDWKIPLQLSILGVIPPGIVSVQE